MLNLKFFPIFLSISVIGLVSSHVSLHKTIHVIIMKPVYEERRRRMEEAITVQKQ